MQGILTYAKAYQLFFQLSQLSFKRYYLCLQAFPLLHSWRFLATPHIFWVNLSWNILHNSVLPNIFVFASVADECLAYVSWKHTSHYIFQDCLWTIHWPSEWLQGVRCHGYVLFRAHSVRGLPTEEAIRRE